MEFKSISSKLPIDEFTLFKDYCGRKGITPSSLIRELILNEIKISIPNFIAGNNHIKYDKINDNFNWCVKLDNASKHNIMKKVNVEFLEDLNEEINKAIKKRSALILKEKTDSISIPTDFLKGEK